MLSESGLQQKLHVHTNTRPTRMDACGGKFCDAYNTCCFPHLRHDGPPIVNCKQAHVRHSSRWKNQLNHNQGWFYRPSLHRCNLRLSSCKFIPHGIGLIHEVFANVEQKSICDVIVHFSDDEITLVVHDYALARPDCR